MSHALEVYIFVYYFYVNKTGAQLSLAVWEAEARLPSM